MAQKRLNRRQMMKKSVGATTALIVGTQFPGFGIAAGDQQTFTGFNGQTMVWGGISYLPNDGPTALPNFFPLIDKTDPGSTVPILNNVLTEAIESVDPAVWEAKDFRLSIAEGGQGGTARYGMIMAVAAELTIQDSRTEINSFTVLRLIAYNFIFSIDKSGGRKVLASYPVGGRVYNAQDGLDKTPVGDYYLRMFTTKSADGDTITDWYRKKLKDYPFGEIKTGLNYRVKTVKLADAARKGLQRMGLAEDTFTDFVGYAATTSFGEKMRVSMVPFKDSRASTGDLAINFRGKEAFRLDLPDGDVVITPTVHAWKVEYKDHPRDTNQFAQKLSVFLQVKIQFAFDDEDKPRFNQLLFAEEVQAVFKEEKYRRSDFATIFLLIEQLLDKTFAAIGNSAQQKILLSGYRKNFTTTTRNQEIKPYIRLKVHKQTAGKFEQECLNVMKI
ncbi:hypothetical protein OAD74_04945 [Alphaproteobacteria bacterium]|nr:hypothetical protein [Alphaproteobacteria bacterium]